MKVVDAGVIVKLTCFDLPVDSLGAEELAAPHLLDSEVLHAIRRHVLDGNLTETRADRALRRCGGGCGSCRTTSVPTTRPMSRLAESLGATSLLTTDARLSRAPGLRCRVEVV
jgi:predicted nucleic acid-binding protein